MTSKLSNEAKRSIKIYGGYRCKAPKVPYRFVETDSQGTMSYNKLYVMCFIRALNTGDAVWHDTAANKVYAKVGSSWVYAVPRGDGTAELYMALNPGWTMIGLIVPADQTENGYDFTSSQSDSLGYFILNGKSLCPAHHAKYL